MGTGKLSGKPDEILEGNCAMDRYRIQVGVVILLVASCHGDQDKLWMDQLARAQSKPTFLSLHNV